MSNPGLEQRWPQMCDPDLTPHQRDMLNKYAGAAFWRAFRHPTLAAKNGLLNQVVTKLADAERHCLSGTNLLREIRYLLAQTKPPEAT